jgi:hypothetical protein
MKVVFTGAWALLIVGIFLAILHEQYPIPLEWNIFCFTFSISILLFGVQNNKFASILAVALLVVSLVCSVIGILPLFAT